MTRSKHATSYLAKSVRLTRDVMDPHTTWTYDETSTSVLERLGGPSTQVASGIHTPPAGVSQGTVSRKRRRQATTHHHPSTLLQDNDPLAKSQAYRESQASQRPVSRHGGTGSGSGVTAPKLVTAKKQSTINTYMKAGLALASASTRAVATGMRDLYSSGSDSYTIPKKNRINAATSSSTGTRDQSLGFTSTGGETRLATIGHNSPSKMRTSSAFSSVMTRGIRKRAAAEAVAVDDDTVVDLSMEDSDQKPNAPTATTTTSLSATYGSKTTCVNTNVVKTTSSSSPPDSISDEDGYLTQDDDTSSTPTSSAAAGMKSDDAVRSSNGSSRDFGIGQTKTSEDDEACEVVSRSMMTSLTNGRARASKVIQPVITKPKLSPPQTSTSLFSKVGQTSYSHSSPVQRVGGICVRVHDNNEVEMTSCDKVEATLNVVNSEKVIRRRDGRSVAEQALHQISTRFEAGSNTKKPGWALTKVNGSKGTLSCLRLRKSCERDSQQANALTTVLRLFESVGQDPR
jgi:hypothetical protein